MPAPSLVTPPAMVPPPGIATLMMLSTVLVPPRMRAAEVDAAILEIAPFKMTGLATDWLA